MSVRAAIAYGLSILCSYTKLYPIRYVKARRIMLFKINRHDNKTSNSGVSEKHIKEQDFNIFAGFGAVVFLGVHRRIYIHKCLFHKDVLIFPTFLFHESLKDISYIRGDFCITAVSCFSYANTINHNAGFLQNALAAHASENAG